MWKIFSGIFLGWTLGANDSANVFGTGVATGTIRYRSAIWLTAGFVLIGALLEGPKCMDVVGDLSRLLPLEAFLCALAAAATMAVLTVLALPSSASQAVVGAVLAVGILSGSADYHKLYKIVVCWVLTPVSGFVFGYLLYWIMEFVLNKTVRSIIHRNRFYYLGILTAGCYGAYCLGANNVANVTGVYVGSGQLSPDAAALIGGLSICLGVLTYSYKVMQTVGKGIVVLSPFTAMVAVMAEALTLHLFTQIGVPVSSSQAVVGAVVGVGMVRDSRTLSPRTLGKIAAGWVMTPVAAGIISFFFIILAGARF